MKDYEVGQKILILNTNLKVPVANLGVVVTKKPYSMDVRRKDSDYGPIRITQSNLHRILPVNHETLQLQAELERQSVAVYAAMARHRELENKYYSLSGGTWRGEQNGR